jgi:hypothetical protein
VGRQGSGDEYQKPSQDEPRKKTLLPQGLKRLLKKSRSRSLIGLKASS